MSLYSTGDCGHSVEFGSNCQQCEWNELSKNIEDLKTELEEEKRINRILHSDRNEVFKLWDMHKYRLYLALEVLEKIYSGLPSYGLLDGSGIDARLEVDKALEKIKEE